MDLKTLFEGIRVTKQLLDLNQDSLIAVTDLNNYRFVEFSPNFDLGVREGHQVKENSVIALAMNTKKPLKKSMNRSNFGIPYIAAAAPLFDEDYRVCGGIVLCTSTDHEEQLHYSALKLFAMTEHLSSSADIFVKSVENLAVSNQEIVNLAKALNEQVKKIESINQIMGQIANQSNLIGLNSAIEASHAGPYGKTFSVVANKIRELASVSQKSALQVKESVVQITESVQEILIHSEQVAAAGRQQAAGAQELSAVIQQINDLASSLNDLAKL